MSQFKVGDEVVSKGDPNKGKVGLVIHIDELGAYVEYYDWNMGHSASGKGKPNHCWWHWETEIELHDVNPHGLVIRKIKHISDKRKRLGYKF